MTSQGVPHESKAEEVIRGHFRRFSGKIELEEKKSSSPRVQKLLATASKTGSGNPGFPDFIGFFKDHPDLVLVVECKGDVAKHESESRERWRDYAVDGVLFYSDHLAKEFDVLSIAFSGTEKRSGRVSHFLQLCQDKPIPVFGSSLLDIESYLHGYYYDERKISYDYKALSAFAKGLNSRLHSNKVPGRNRALLIASILIALERQSFRDSYRSEADSKALAKSITANVSYQLQESGIQSALAEDLSQRFGVAEHENALLANDGELQDVVRSFHDEISTFRRDHQFVDVLGELYVEFLRYANSDKGLGIVLTPPHITDLFAEIARVDVMSRVYDNCAGTGGFLIAAMKRMVKDAKGNNRSIRNVKQRQLFGVEIQSDIFPLLLANMYVHQDGKTSMKEGDCFDSKITAPIVRQKPTVGLLNPPYRSDKKKDRHELEFVEHNLDSLQEGGICVALLPMQCALDVRGRAGEIKRRIMERHSLEAVLSLPDELFFNSDVGVVSCAMVFRAGQQHNEESEVFLGYYKDDGFVKTKTAGRTDDNGDWPARRKKWVDTLLNRREQTGFSTKVKLSYDREWAVEAYMETNYTSISDSLFVRTLLNYSAYLFKNQLLLNASSAPKHGAKRPLLKVSDWAPFMLSDYFDIQGTKTTSLADLEEAENALNGYPYVTTKAIDNGVAGFYKKWTEPGGVLTVDSAVKGYCAYQKRDFTASDHVEKLVPKFKMDDYIAMFLVTIINLEQYRYNYGRKCSQARLRQTRIKLPAKEANPDWNLMRRYIQSLQYSANLNPSRRYLNTLAAQQDAATYQANPLTPEELSLVYAEQWTPAEDWSEWTDAAG